MYYLHDLILYYFTNFELLLWGSRVGFSLIFSIDHCKILKIEPVNS